MNEELKKNLETVRSMLEIMRRYEHALHVMNYDMETICPPAAMEEEGATIAFLQTEGFKIRMSDAFIKASEYLYEHRFGSGTEDEPGEDGLDELDRKLAVLRHLTRNGQEARKNRVQIRVRYFSPCMDENSSAYGDGGIYKTVSGICRKIDTVSGTITVDDHVLPIEDITDIDGELFRETAYGTGRDGGV